MNIQHYHVQVVEGAEQLALLKRGDDDARELGRRITAWAESFGGTGWQRLRERVVSIVFPGSSPPTSKLWRRAKVQGHLGDDEVAYVPSRTSKAGKALANTMAEFKLPTGEATAIKLGANGRFCIGPWAGVGTASLALQSDCFHMGDRHFVVTPNVDSGNPVPPPVLPGCRLIRLSEFYALREAHEAAEAVTP